MLKESGVPEKRIAEIQDEGNPFWVRAISLDARLVCELIGRCGYILRVNHGNGIASLVDMPYPRGHRKWTGGPAITRTPACVVPTGVVQELIEKQAISTLTEFEDNCRVGWRDVGVDGSNCDLYLMRQ